MSSGSNPDASRTPVTLGMPMPGRVSPARPRPARPIGVRVAAMMTASLASVMGCASSGPYEDGDRELVGNRLKADLHGHAHRQFVEGAVDHVGHHAWPLGQVDDGGDVGHAVTEGQLIVGVDDRPRVQRAFAARFVPLDPLAPALRAEGPRIVGVGVAVEAVLYEEALLFGRLPEGKGVALRRGKVESDRAHDASPFTKGPGTRGRGPRASNTLACAARD